MKLICPNCLEENEFAFFQNFYACKFCGQTNKFEDWTKKTQEAQKAKTETKAEKAIKPLYKAYWPLGEGQGISATLWENNLQLERRVRDQSGNWKTEQEINLARSILEKLYIRLPILFEQMKSEEEKVEK